MKKVLSIAGSDCSGGAGIQADLKTFAAHGVFGMSVVVSVVAENTSRVIDIQDVTPDMILKQIEAVFEDIEVDAVKVGMLSNPGCMQAVADGLLKWNSPSTPVVVDPVMYAKNGSPLMAEGSIDALIKTMLPLADVLTPNVPEAEKISGMKINSLSDMEAAAKRICELGCRGAVLVKGGHSVGGTDQSRAIDVLYDGIVGVFSRFDAPRVDTKNTHGTGCTYSSAIASNLALDMDLRSATLRAKAYVTTAIEHALPIGKGCGPTHHFYELYRHGLN
ncbi:MAG: bifunctional hydroxymethylpyrimidine kinase/phosphomethylpyrimidine kinase [Synergistaceae bacterium]|jgi:hydroxymethylpyrimidine/phosphomethylpyrimidine kinase|nr:bifunctional hydroxymethylpyrimidine kinase/phosphomethylpyrimidine kinase [Synergistaceae bacterium]